MFILDKGAFAHPHDYVVLGPVDGWPKGWYRIAKLHDIPGPHNRDGHREIQRTFIRDFDDRQLPACSE